VRDTGASTRIPRIATSTRVVRADMTDQTMYVELMMAPLRL
jgi:hypothetical protein